MGFDKIIAWMGVAVILTITLSAFFLIYNNTVADMHEFYKTDKQMLDQYKTGFSIENATYNDSGSIWVYAKNTGKGDIALQNSRNNDCIDVLIDNVWISKANFSANVTNNAYDSLIWNPKEYLNIIVNQNLAAGMHTLTIVECRGLKKTIQFQVARNEFIYFVPPTENNWATISKNWTHVNITINATNINTFRFNWNGTNTTVYNDSLALLLNFNNNSAIGENSTNAVDVSKYNNSADCYNGTLRYCNWSANGKYSSAMRFDGVNDYIKVQNSSTLNIFNYDGFAIEFWIYKYTSSVWSVVMGKCKDTGLNRWIITRNSGPNSALWLYAYDADSGGNYANTSDISDNVWHHVAFTGVINSWAAAYVDGVLVKNDSIVGLTKFSSTDNFYIGARLNVAMSDYTNSTIDELRLYDRTLAPKEVLLHYQSELQKYSTGEWRFYANVTNLTEGTYSYYGWASDTLGNSGQTDSGTLRYLIRNTSVLVQFVSPTMSNGTTINRLWAEANITATPADGLDTVKLNWNGTNITFYNNTGPYRRELSIYNPGNALTNYQVKFVFNSSTLDNAADFFSKASNDSIRFVPGVLLYQNLSATVPYWVESWNATAQQAIVWIKIPYLTANAYTPVTMYYGGSGSSLSNGNDTFIFFDDFETNRGWTFSRNPNLYWIGQYSAVTYVSPTNSYEIFFPSATVSNPGDYGRITKTLVFDGSQVKTEFSVYDSRNTASPAGYHYKQAYLAGSQLYSLDIAADNMQWDNISAITTPPAGSQDLYLQMYDVQGVSSFGASVFWDNVKIRKYQSPEPSSSIGSESGPSSFYVRIENLSDGAYGYYGWANNSWAKSGQTDSGLTRYITINPVWLSFVPPTENNGTTIDRNWTEANITINTPRGLDSFRFNWNGTNYTFYDSSLLLAYNFNNNSAIGENSTRVMDLSGYGNNGNLTNGTQICGDMPGCPGFVSGVFGKGMQFDGIDDSVNVGNGSSLKITGPITMEAWVRINNLSVSQHLFGRGRGQSSDGNYGYATTFGYSAGNVYICWDTYNTTIRDNGCIQNVITNLNWHHLAVTWDGTTAANSKKIYLDGALFSQWASIVPSIGIPNWNFTLGRSGNNDQPFNGTIDEIRVYNRNLSAQEIRLHYQSEFQKYNSTEYRFYANITNLSAGTYTYYGWANDTIGNIGQTDDGSLRYITVNSTLIRFVAPTLTNGSTTSNNWAEANMTVGKPTILDTLKFSWNGTNITFYNVSGPYKREIQINNTGDAIIDYQVRLVFNSSTLDNAADFFSKASSANIRFYPQVLLSANLSSVVPYWVEYWNSTANNATVWIKAPYVTANSITPINMYYGGSGSSQSNGTQTFLFFDDFNDGSISDWNAYTKAFDAGDAASQAVDATTYASGPYSLKLYTHSHCGWAPFDGVYSGVNTTLSLERGNYSVDFNYKADMLSQDMGTGYERTYIYNNATLTFYNSLSSASGVPGSTGWLSKSNATENITIISLEGFSTDCAEGATWFDNVRVRKRAASEPGNYIGAENTLTMASFYVRIENLSDATYGYYGWVNTTAAESGQTDYGNTRYLTVNTFIYFAPPTENNATTINRTWTPANVTIKTASLDTFKFNWNGTNYTFYDSSLLLAYNFNNNSAIGENYNNSNGTKIADISKYGYNGTLYVGANYNGNYSSGRYGGAYNFDGVDDYVNTNVDLSWTTAQNFTIEFWMMPKTQTAGIQGILGKGEAGGYGTSNWEWGIYKGVGGINFFYFDTGGTAILSVACSTTAEQWNHIAVVYNPTDKGRLYRDGVMVYNDSDVSGTFQNRATPMLIGHSYYSAGANYYFNGSIDELRVYNRSLSAQEVLLHYQSEFQKYNAGEWRFYANVTNLSAGTYTYYGWANSTAGISGQTDFELPRYVTVIPPEGALNIAFVPPTQNNQAIIATNWTEANVSINATALDSFKFNWNATNYTFYDNSLVLALNFNNNSAIGENNNLAVDISKYGNNASCTNCPVWNSSGRFGGAFDYNGSSNYFMVNDSNSLDASTGLTIEAWIYAKSCASGVGFDRIVLKQNSMGDGSYQLQFSGTTCKIYFGINSPTTIWSDLISIASNTVLQNNTWYHVAGTYDGSMLKVYVNGAFDNNRTKSGNIANSATNVYIGTTSDIQDTTFYNGSIDEVRIYTRALSSQEILLHYQSEFQKYSPIEYRFYANVTNLSIGTYAYYAWANNTEGTSGQTDAGALRYITISSGEIEIAFVPPTQNNQAIISANWTEANVTINTTALDSFKFNWNGTNITFYNVSGPYKREILINNSGNVTVDYQVRLVFNSSTLDNTADFFSKANESNIRFYPEVLSSANLSSGISHWVEYWNSTTMQATVWIKVPYLLANSNTPVNMYYGGSGANQGNGDATFILFDHFDDSSLNTSKWNPPIVSAYFGYVETGSDMIIYTGTRGKTPIYNGENYMNATKSYNMSGTAYDLRVKSTKENADAWYTSLIIGGRLNNGTQSLSFGRHGQSPLKYFSTVGPVDWESGAWDGSLTSYETETLRTFGNNVYYDRNGSLQYTDSKSLTDMQNPYVIEGVGQAITQTAWGEIYVDWAIIRKYTSPEPIAAVGAEKTPSQFYVRIENLTEGTYAYYGWANNSAGRSGQTDNGNPRYITISSIYFVWPTQNNASIIITNWTEANVTIGMGTLDTFKFNWNGTNYTFYNSSLILDVNFNNYSAIGDSPTKAVDISKYANNGTISGAVYAPGKYGRGLLLNGVSDYVNFGRPASLDRTTALSVEAWIKTGDPVGLLLWRENCFMESWRLYVDVSNIRALGSSTGAAWDWVIVGGNVTDNQWHHVAMTFDSAVGMKLYLDGRLNGTSSAAGSLKASGAYDVHLGYTGACTIYNNANYNGTVDELRMYDHALTANEILMHYQSELQKYDSETYRFYANVSNLSAGTYTYYGWANSTEGRSGQTDSGNPRYITVSSSLVPLYFVPPTQNNATSITTYWMEANATISTSSLDTLKFNWNGTNITFYNVSGPYKREIMINNTGAVTYDYQVKLVFNSSTLDNSADFFSKANSSNIRFYPTVLLSNNLSSGVPYWVEYWNSAANNATVWIKVPYMMPNNNTQINMYYGGSGTTQSNGTQTFLFFDDFDDGSISDWNAYTKAFDAGDVATQAVDATTYASASYSLKLYTHSHCATPPWDGVNSGVNKTLSLGQGNYSVDFNYRADIISTEGLSVYGRSYIYNNATLTFYNSLYSSIPVSTGWLSQSNATENLTIISLEGFSGDCAEAATWFDNVRVRKRASSEPSNYIGAEYNSNTSSFYVRIENLSEGTYTYYGWANNSLGFSGQTDNGNPRYIYVNTFIYFMPPTQASGTSLSRNWTEANITVNTSNIDTFKFNWNGTTYTFYDNNLVLAMNYNNNSAIGESASNVADISRYANNATIYRAVWNSSGRFGGALWFDGNSSYVSVPSASSLALGNNFTIEGFFKSDASFGNSSDSSMGLLDKGSYQLFLDRTDGKMKFFADSNNTKNFSALSWGFNNTVRAFIVYNGSLYAGGAFTSASGVSANRTARWNGTGWSPLGTGMNNTIYAFGLWNGSLFAGGAFTTASGSVVNYTARWNGTNWVSMGTGVNSAVYCFAAYNGSLYVGGAFTSAGGVPANRTARWNGTNWSAVGSTGQSGMVSSLVVFNGSLYVSGQFNMSDGGSTNRTARWNGTKWVPVGTVGMNSTSIATVNVLAVYNGSLYAGGTFGWADGSLVNKIARFNGTKWNPLNQGLDGNVLSMAVYNGSLYVGGGFFNGDGAPVNYITHWNGTNWSALGSGMSDIVNSLVVYNGSLYAGGDFLTANGRAVNRTARYNGSADLLLSSATNTWDTNWHHIAIVYNGSTISIYHNGVLETSASRSMSLPPTTSALLIGKTYGGKWGQNSGDDEGLFKGLLDEVRIYNRTMNASEVLMHYQSELQEYNTSEWRFYVNVTNLTTGTYAYYGWANNSARSGQTDNGNRYYTYS